MPTNTSEFEVGGAIDLESLMGGSVWDAEERSGFEPIPAGEYNAEIDSIGNPDVSGTGKTYLPVTLRITDGQYQGRLLFDKLWVTDDSRWRMKQFFIAMERDEDAGSTYDPGEFDGRACRVKVSQRKYHHNGEDRVANDIKRYYPPTEEQKTADWG